jgi:xanthine/CO dehydrogenase XdhC/CoxF family maturation factor
VVDLLIERVPPFLDDRLLAEEAAADPDAFEWATSAARPLNVLRFASGLLRERSRGVVATIVSAPLGAGARSGDHLFLAEKGSVVRSEIEDPGLGAALAAAAGEHLAGGAARLASVASTGGPVEVFLDRIEPPPSLVVFGAGYDAVPVVRLASELGYEVALVDHRAAFATPERFPQAEAIFIGHPAEVWDRLPLAPDTSVVILTHNYALDRELLERLLPSPVSYIGLLGPALRKEQILEELQQAGLALAEETLARLHAPIGLDLGADTPETVALAILAEMQAVRAGHTGGPLRERQGPIHSEKEPS